MNERSIFLAALEETDPDQRRHYLDEACGNDDALREQVEQLLTAHQDADSFLENPPAEFIPSITTNILETAEGRVGGSPDRPVQSGQRDVRDMCGPVALPRREHRGDDPSRLRGHAATDRGRQPRNPRLAGPDH